MAGSRMRILKKAVLALAAVLSLLAASALACFSQADLYAVEVVLSKPGVTYDLSKLKVEQVEPGVYAYRSPGSSKLLVIVSEAEVPPLSGKFLAVRVQVPLRTVSRQEYSCVTELPTLAILGPVELELGAGTGEASLDLGALSLKGPAVLLFEPALEVSAREQIRLVASGVLELQGSRSSRRVAMPCFAVQGEGCARVTMVIPGFDEPLAAGADAYRVGAVVSWMSSERLRGRFLVRVRGVVLDPGAAAGWEPDSRAFYGAALSKVTEEFNVTVSFTRRSLTATVVGEGNLSRALEEVEKLIEAIGLSCSLEPAGPADTAVAPAFAVSRDELVAVLKSELQWLIEVGVLSGLGSEDVEALAREAEVGFAGWNSRLVWSDGWRPYSSVEGALLVRCVKAPPGVASLEAFERVQYRGGEGSSTRRGGLLLFLGAVALIAALILAAILARRRR